MRITSTGAGARAAYYDRNPLQVSIFYSAAGVAPHGSTSRSVYTVPTGRKAFVELVDETIIQQAAGTVAGDCNAQVIFTGGATIIVHEDSFAVGIISQKVVGSVGMIGAGQTATIFTADGNTGGTHQFDISCKITEFDA